MEFFTVGGCIRDEFLGVPSNDIDFTIVLSPDELDDVAKTVNPRTPFEIMVGKLESMGFEIFVSSPEHFTARARVPKVTTASDGMAVLFMAKYPGQTFDFVLARKEGDYNGRRPGRVEVGTLEDDLARRDFCMNAIAKSMTGEIIDPFNGRQDINERVIRAVGNAADRLAEDALRAIRAMRFAITTGFRIDHELMFAMELESVLDNIKSNVVADDRIRAEVRKMTSFDTWATVVMMNRFPSLTQAMFSGSVWLAPSMKEK